MGLLVSALFGFVPMLIFAAFVYWLDRFEKEPLRLLGFVFLWGAVIASLAALLLNTFAGVGIYFLTTSETLANFATGSFIAPVVEEIFKSLAVLVVFLVFRSEFDSVLDGVIYASITALGFAATENTYYIYTYGYLENSWTGLLGLVFIRVILVAWQHPFYTAFFGIGLGIARTTRKVWLKWTAPIGGLALSILMHSLHNTISSIGSEFVCVVGSILDWSGWLLMFLFVLWIIERERKMIAAQLESEIDLCINREIYEGISTPFYRLPLLINALFNRQFGKTLKILQLCAELAHKKNQHSLDQNNVKTIETIQTLQQKLKLYSTQISAR